jgi:peptidylprolyl isomerase
MRQTVGPTMTVIVIEVTEAAIVVDANHPLAGKDLTFEIELLEIK